MDEKDDIRDDIRDDEIRIISSENNNKSSFTTQEGKISAITTNSEKICCYEPIILANSHRNSNLEDFFSRCDMEMNRPDKSSEPICEDSCEDFSEPEPELEPKCENNSRRKKWRTWVSIIGAAIVICIITVLCLTLGNKSENKREVTKSSVNVATSKTSPAIKSSGYVDRRDTTANGVDLMILTPVDATPVLEIGSSVLNDSTITLIAQAADIRGDNGQILGTYVSRGELVSKGESKAGFCSIIDGNMTIGVADASPMLEQALTTDGYFFRQYPLVVAGQLVENKPKGRSIRKALAELNGKICIIQSENRVTFHDFSQALVDLGVSNAIYLIGSDAYTRYKDKDGKATVFGTRGNTSLENLNYIVWR